MIRINCKELPFIILLLFFALFFSLILLDVFSFNYHQTFLIAYIYFAGFIFTLVFNKKIPRISMSMIVIYYTLIQAIGIPLAYIFAPKFTIEQIKRSKYLYGLYMDKYLAVLLLGVTVFLIAFLIFGKNNLSYSNRKTNNTQTTCQKIYCYIGVSFLLFFAFFMLLNVLIGNIKLGDYAGYKIWANSNAIRNYSQIAFWISSILICYCGTKRQILFSIIVFSIPALILLIAGNRNDVLFPLLIGLGIYCVRFKEVPKFILAISVLLIFIISPMIVSLRNNIFSIEGSILESIGESLFELGAQLHCVSTMFSWLENGENFAYGMTYTLGILGSILGDFFPEINTFFNASRFFIASRVPNLGFAMAAEIYFNFGVPGILIIYFIVGVISSKNELKDRTVQQNLWYGFFMLWLLILVRNVFGYSFVYFKVFFIIFIIGELLNKILKKEKQGAYIYGKKNFFNSSIS